MAPASTEREGAHRLAHAFEADLADRLQLEEARHQSSGVRGEIDRSCLGDLLHSRSQPDGVPLGRVVHAQVVADRTNDHLAGVEPHTHGEGQPARALQLLRVQAQLLAQVQGCVAGALRMILVRHRRTEQGHGPIAGKLVDGALKAMDAVAEDGEEPVHDAMPLLRVHALGQQHRPLHVDEEHRHLLALSGEGAALS